MINAWWLLLAGLAGFVLGIVATLIGAYRVLNEGEIAIYDRVWQVRLSATFDPPWRREKDKSA